MSYSIGECEKIILLHGQEAAVQPGWQTRRVPAPAPHLMESDDRLGMDADDVQTPAIALKQLCKQAEEDGTDLLILRRGKGCGHGVVRHRVRTSQLTGQELAPGTEARGSNHASESQNHRIVGVGRDLCGSSSPTPLPKQGQGQLLPSRAGNSAEIPGKKGRGRLDSPSCHPDAPH